MKTINVWTDGSIEGGNPGGHGVGGYVIKGMFQDTKTGTVDLGKSPDMTNNIAEYEAVKAALEELVLWWLAYRDPLSDLVVVHSDSKLVVEQCNDNWNCNNMRLKSLRDDIWGLCDLIDCPVEFKWIPREENTEADEVSRSLYNE